jgi:hypothetical protein
MQEAIGADVAEETTTEKAEEPVSDGRRTSGLVTELIFSAESESAAAEQNESARDDSESPIFRRTQCEDEPPLLAESQQTEDSVTSGMAVSLDGEAPPSLPPLPVTEPMSPREEACDQILTAMIKKKLLPEFDVRADVINHAKKKSAKLMLAQEYDEAAEIDMAIDLLFMSIEQDLREQNSEHQTKLLQDRLNECKAMEQKVCEDWDQIIENVRQRTAVKLKRLKEFHNFQLDELERDWSDPDAKIPYSKPSPELLQIRQKQKAYALLHDFANAKAMKSMAEAREKLEAVEGAKRFKAAVRMAHAQLLVRQQREIECLVQNAESVISLYQIDKEKWLASVSRTKRSLELRITSPKVMKKPTVQLPILSSRPSSVNSSTTVSSVPTTGMITQRTRDQLAKYRKAPEMGRLDLKTSEVHTIVRPSPRKHSRSESSEFGGSLDHVG